MSGSMQRSPTMEPALTDLSGFSRSETTATEGSAILNQWWQNDQGDRLLVTIPSPLDGNRYEAAMARQISVLGRLLGLPVNVVQVVPLAMIPDAADAVVVEFVKANVLAAILDDLPADEIEVQRQLDTEEFTASLLEKRFASVHHPVGAAVTVQRTGGAANPELGDQLFAFDRLIGHAGRHPRRLLLVPDAPLGVTTYKGQLPDDCQGGGNGCHEADRHTGRAANLTAYLQSLALPENATHRQNVQPVLTAFARLTERQLVRDPLAGLPEGSYDIEAIALNRQVLLALQAAVRDFLAS